MEFLEIPITAEDASFKIRTVLEDVPLVMRFDWNGRDSRWQMSVYDADENPLLVGVPLNINTEIFERFEIEGLPPGEILLYDTTDTSEEAGRDDLGDRCRLFYRTSV